MATNPVAVRQYQSSTGSFAPSMSSRPVPRTNIWRILPELLICAAILGCSYLFVTRRRVKWPANQTHGRIR